ncbi:hypothetical protein [uncultured Adlercreutzia sp.]|uniref:hypothetical protein n=1 Tax=uncultured Adlercreutzia sp. TaxID=875803 RepID=UPI0025FA9C12|nr:hypothetical protein [uncultured Adlercreutzia sp.]
MAKNLAAAAASGCRRDTLEALRDELARTIQATDSGRDIAALSKRLMEVMAELDALPDDDAAAQTALSRQRRRVGARKAASDG